MERSRLIFSGSGGQGVITAAIILAKAAALFENKHAVQSQSYGAAARGGSTRSDVIIDDTQIFFPKVTQANILISLTQESYNTFSSLIRPGGLLLVDSKYVTVEKKVAAKHIALPMFDTVQQKIGNPLVFNICMLGAVIGLSDLIRPESIINVLEKSVPADFLDINRIALDLGVSMGIKNRN